MRTGVGHYFLDNVTIQGPNKHAAGSAVNTWQEIPVRIYIL